MGSSLGSAQGTLEFSSKLPHDGSVYWKFQRSTLGCCPGGLGILVGDGQLPNYRTEKVFEAYYSHAMTASTRLTFDYQFLANPAYNADRGRINIFAGRAHWQF
jgi:hypothetical protein